MIGSCSAARPAACLLAVLLAVSAGVACAELPHHPLLDQAKSEDGKRVAYAVRNNARIELTDDGQSFYVLWFPEGQATGERPPMIVTIHGHGSWAFDEFYLWHEAARSRGYGILAIQWWSGRGERSQDYLRPQDIYRIVDQILTKERILPRRALFHGFSRGAANSYGVAAMDRATGKNYFALFVANAGMPGPDSPPIRDIEEGRFGASPLEGTHWVTFAGGRDPHPERDGIEGMRKAADWIRKYGGVVDLAIEDANADHGGFHHSRAAMDAALNVFTKRSL